MRHWERYGDGRCSTISPGTGRQDLRGSQILRVGDLYVLLYFRLDSGRPAYNTFAVSRDLVHWTKWTGEPLIQSEYDWEDCHAAQALDCAGGWGRVSLLLCVNARRALYCGGGVKASVILFRSVNQSLVAEKQPPFGVIPAVGYASMEGKGRRDLCGKYSAKISGVYAAKKP